VSFEIENSSLTTLKARPPIPTEVLRQFVLRSRSEARSPRFPVSGERAKSGWWSSLKVICERVNLPVLREPLKHFRNTPVAPFRFAGRAISGSVLLHVVLILLLPVLLSYTAAQQVAANMAYDDTQKIIYYQIPKHDPFEKLPKITPSGEGGQPGAGELQALLQKIGSTTSARKIVIVSKPVRPDNKRQTIYQPATPPDLHIDMDLKLPNIVGGPVVPIAKPQVHMDANNSKPRVSHRTATKAVAPTLAAINSAIATSLPPATVAKPHLAVPLNESRPVQAQMVIGQVNAPSLSTATVTTATNLGDSYHAGQPDAPAAPPGDTEASGNGKASKNDAVQTAGDGSGIVVIGVDPAEEAALAKLPPGNRWGDFTIAPGGGQPGAVNGSENGMTGAGSHSTGGGGDLVPGVGPGFAGGGGGKSGTSGSLSISGEAGAKGEAMLDATIFREMVYPVPSTVVLRKNALVVSAGPMGGGGLNVYGALQCGKIYTVFLPMPGRPWTLQFCQSGAGQKPNPQGRSAVVHMESGIVQPDVTTRFDFKRLPVPFEKKNKPIVLKGVIKEDGTVSDLKVFQGIVPGMDDAARVAFSRWKFKAAIRDGKNVAVDILVGIPTEGVPGKSQ
jgi:Gram-negative bacterial TonB protein C-terminal